MEAKKIDKELTDEVYKRFISARMRTQNTGETRQTLPLGPESLNEIIGDGLPYGSFTYVRGHWGAGRWSVILNAVAYNLRNADRSLKILFSLEEKDIYSTAYRLASIVTNVSSFAGHKISADDFLKLRKVKQLSERHDIRFLVAASPKEIRRACLEFHPDIIVIDEGNTCPGRNYNRYETIAKESNAVVLIRSRLESDIETQLIVGCDASEIAGQALANSAGRYNARQLIVHRDSFYTKPDNKRYSDLRLIYCDGWDSDSAAEIVVQRDDESELIIDSVSDESDRGGGV